MALRQNAIPFLRRARRANPFLRPRCRSYASACPASNPIQSIAVVFAKLALSPVPLFAGRLTVAQASNKLLLEIGKELLERHLGRRCNFVARWS